MMPLAILLVVTLAMLSQEHPGYARNVGTISEQSAILTRLRVTAQSLNLRAGPGTDFPSLGSVSFGDLLTQAGGSRYAPWIEVVTDSGDQGYVHSDYVRAVEHSAASQYDKCLPDRRPNNGTVLKSSRGQNQLKVENLTDSDAVVKLKHSGKDAFAAYIRSGSTVNFSNIQMALLI
jgi:uncharacterized protein YgiM (DUF1202 family)